MKRFFHNSKGAVTILVTLLLIPSVLVSGTAVDAARIYTTRNAVQNANQLAANAALASYSSLLKDLYALFGFMSDDPKLAEMVDEYVGITIFGKDEDKGTFRSFIGSDEYSTSLDPSGNLRKTEVLKQQILEYMKFRGPAIIIQRIFGELGSGRAEKISEDSYILELKQDIDESLEEVLNRYKELYYAIMQADSCRESNGPDYMSVADSPFSLIMDELDEIRNDFETLEEIHEAYHKTFDPEKRTPLATKYKDTISDIIKRAGNIEQHLNDTKENAGAFKVYFIRVVTVAEELDRLKENLKRKVDTLRQRLQQGKCSQEIYDAFTKSPPKDPDGKPLINRYDEVLNVVVLPMAIRYRDDGMKYVDDVLLPTLDDPLFIRYRDNKVETTEENSLTLWQLKNLSSSDPDYDFRLEENRTEFFAGLSDPDDAGYVDFLDLLHQLPDPFYKFGNGDHFGAEQEQFWLDLKAMVSGSGTAYIDVFDPDNPHKNSSDGSEKAQRNQINTLKGMGDGYDIDVESGGAKRIDDPEWKSTQDRINLLSLVGNIIDVFSSPKKFFSESVDYSLVLTYDMSMFSHYTTNNKHHTNGDAQSITCVPMSRHVNYYYQAEWEYLLIGDKDGSSNVGKIKTLIYEIRFILNFIAVWGIDEINIIVNLIRALPIPFGIPFILGEIARLGFFLAETSSDVARLRKGCKVALFKNNDTWVCKPSTFWKLAAPHTCDNTGFTYENYLTVFFVAKAMATSNPSDAANVLTNRTADLIEWNVINYQHGFDADEQAMSELLTGGPSPDIFRMRNAATTFSIETTVDMRMLFLSMPFAQRGVNGVIPPKTLPITMTDYRGY